MKFLKVAVTVILFLVIIAGLFLLALYGGQWKPEKTADINARYSEKPAYLLPAKTVYSIASWDVGAAVTSAECDAVFEGGRTVRPPQEMVDTTLTEIKNYLENFADWDFLMLQEVDLNAKRSYGVNQIREISSVFPKHAFSFARNHNVSHIPFPLFSPYGKVTSGIEIISAAYPLESVRYGFEQEASLLRALFAQNNCCIVNDYRLRNGKTLVIINVQNGDFALKEPSTTLIQSLIALMVTEYEQGNYVISGGNWNVNPPGFSDAAFSSQDSVYFTPQQFPVEYLPEGWKIYYDASAPTTRKLDAPYQKGVTPTTITDFFIVSPNVQAVEQETISLDFKWSAHNPVVLRFGLK